MAERLVRYASAWSKIHMLTASCNARDAVAPRSVLETNVRMSLGVISANTATAAAVAVTGRRRGAAVCATKATPLPMICRKMREKGTNSLIFKLEMTTTRRRDDDESTSGEKITNAARTHTPNPIT